MTSLEEGGIQLDHDKWICWRFRGRTHVSRKGRLIQMSEYHRRNAQRERDVKYKGRKAVPTSVIPESIQMCWRAINWMTVEGMEEICRVQRQKLKQQKQNRIVNVESRSP